MRLLALVCLVLFSLVSAIPSWRTQRPSRNIQNFIGFRRFLSGIPFRPREDLMPMRLARFRREVIIEQPSK